MVLGDLLNDRYRTIRKLGYGAFSTAWLAVDQSSNCFVALKVAVASLDPEIVDRNLALYRSPSQTDKRHRVDLRDFSEVLGLNGRHTCLVMDLMGPHISALLRVDLTFRTDTSSLGTAGPVSLTLLSTVSFAILFSDPTPYTIRVSYTPTYTLVISWPLLPFRHSAALPITAMLLTFNSPQLKATYSADSTAKSTAGRLNNSWSRHRYRILCHFSSILLSRSPISAQHFLSEPTCHRRCTSGSPGA